MYEIHSKSFASPIAELIILPRNQFRKDYNRNSHTQTLYMAQYKYMNIAQTHKFNKRKEIERLIKESV